MKKYCFLLYAFICFGTGIVNAQYTRLLNFNDTNGRSPMGSVILSGNTLYGMAQNGGAHGLGCIFSIDTSGNNYSDLHDFDGIKGENPYGDLLLYRGKLYGMAEQGDSLNYGCIFSININGTDFTDLHKFLGTDGKYPYGSLIEVNNVLYGMVFGGINGTGGIFSIDTNGNGYRIVYGFSGTDGPTHGNLLLAGKKFYGMSFLGGVGGYGDVFSVDTNGLNYKELIDFDIVDGEQPFGSLVISGTQLFGMTYEGGANGDGNVFSIDTNGSSFKDILDFNGANGKGPNGSLLIWGDKLYGMTTNGGVGSSPAGCIFSIDTNGNNYKQRFSFDGYDGGFPNGTLIMAGKTFFGMTSEGGNYSDGVVFKLDTNAITGINTLITNAASVNLYPNPNNGAFTFEVINYQPEEKNILEVYTMLGDKIYTTQLNDTHTLINLHCVNSGIYLYRIITETGTLVSTGKFIIQ